MTFLPIVERELRVRARLKSTYRFRLFAAVGAIGLVGLLLLMSENRVAAGKFGGMLFGMLAWLAFLYCLLEGARNTADCLSEEKRAGTLGLLFLTDLRPHDVILGKLVATSLNSFYGLLAIFPPLAIPLVTGGVTVGEFWRGILVLMNTLFFSLAIGMAMSSVSREGKRAWAGTVGILLFFAIVPPWLRFSPAGSSSWLAALSPTTGFINAFDAAYSIAPDHFWRSLGSIHLVGWLALGVATFVLPRSWQDRPLTPGIGRRRLFGGRTSTSPPGDGFTSRALLLDSNPIVWLVTRGAREQAWLWTLVSIVSGVAMTAWVLTSGMQSMAVMIFGVMLLVHLAMAIWLASEACHLFADARESGALELLLCTPLTPREIIEGHLLGLRRGFYRPVVGLLVVECFLLAGQVYVTRHNPTLSVFLVVLVGLCLAGAWMDLVAVARFGLWQGLATRQASKAVTKTVLYVLILPLAFGILCFLGTLWPLLSVVKNLVLINFAKEQLRRRFRALLTEQPGWTPDAELMVHPTKRSAARPLPPVLPS